MALPLIEIERKLAKRRQLSGGYENLPQNFGEGCERGETLKIIAEKLGDISHETVRKALKIIEYGSEELKEKVR